MEANIHWILDLEDFALDMSYMDRRPSILQGWFYFLKSGGASKEHGLQSGSEGGVPGVGPSHGQMWSSSGPQRRMKPWLAINGNIIFWTKSRQLLVQYHLFRHHLHRLLKFVDSSKNCFCHQKKYLALKINMIFFSSQNPRLVYTIQFPIFALF